MNTSMNWLLRFSEHEVLFATALLLTKITILLAVAWCVHGLLRKSNPRWRVLLWRSTGTGMLLLIALTACPPILSWSVLPPEALPSEPLSSRNSRPSPQSAGQAVSRVVQGSPAAAAQDGDQLPASQASREDRVAWQQSRPHQPLVTSKPDRPEPSPVVTEIAAAPAPARNHTTVVLCAIGGLWFAGLVGLVTRLFWCAPAQSDHQTFTARSRLGLGTGKTCERHARLKAVDRASKDGRSCHTESGRDLATGGPLARGASGYRAA